MTTSYVRGDSVMGCNLTLHAELWSPRRLTWQQDILIWQWVICKGKTACLKAPSAQSRCVPLTTVRFPSE